MRIIAGIFKGKKLLAPDGQTTRPTSDRARESLFNILESILRKQGKSWIDMIIFDSFAGTGALGLEALSRGAKKLFSAEIDKKAQACFNENAKAFRGKGLEIKLFSDALILPKSLEIIDILFLDPPYNKGYVPLALTELKNKGWLSSNTICVIEVENGEKDILPAGFVVNDKRTYGKAEVLFVQLED